MNKEIQEFQESFFFGLSMRQCFFSVLAIAAAVGVYLGTKDTCGTEIAGWLSVFARFDLVTRGTAPYVEWLGQQENPNGGGWAAGSDYGEKLRKLLAQLKAE